MLYLRDIALDKRVVAIQRRANNLLQLHQGIATITVKKSERDASISSTLLNTGPMFFAPPYFYQLTTHH